MKAHALLEAGERIDMKVAKRLVDESTPRKEKAAVHVNHVEIPGGMIVIRTTKEVDPRRALLAALSQLKDAEKKAA